MKIFFTKKRISIGVVILSCLFAIIPLLQPGFFPMHDDEQVGRLYQLDKVLHQGHFPPRITPDLGFGNDYLLFNFYPPFVYYVAEIFVFLGFSYIWSIKLMIISGFFLAALFMYLFVKEYLDEYSAVVAAVVYTYAPYHAVDVYVRGALPEFWSFVLLPALFWSVTRLSKTLSTRYLLATAISLAFFILTHNLMVMLSGVFFIFYCLYLFFHTKKRIRFVMQTAISIVLGFALSAFFAVPSFFERKFTLVDLLTKELANYNLHFVYLRQFLFSAWGYGGSIYGLDDNMSFQIGYPQIILAGCGVVLLLIGVRKNKKNIGIGILMAFFAFFSIIMQTFYSKIIWDLISPLWYVQFPWRFLMITAFTMAFLSGFVPSFFTTKKIKIVIVVLAVIGVIGCNWMMFRPEKQLTRVNDNDYTADEVIHWRTSKMAFEYVPKGVQLVPSEVGNSVIDITQQEINPKSYLVVSGDIQVTEKKDLAHRKEYTTSSTTSGVLRFSTFDFPGWVVTIDGNTVQHTANNKLRLITTSVPKGEHSITLEFINTSIRFAANTISAVAWIGVILYICYSIYSHYSHGRK